MIKIAIFSLILHLSLTVTYTLTLNRLNFQIGPLLNTRQALILKNQQLNNQLGTLQSIDSITDSLRLHQYQPITKYVP